MVIKSLITNKNLSEKVRKFISRQAYLQGFLVFWQSKAQSEALGSKVPSKIFNIQTDTPDGRIDSNHKFLPLNIMIFNFSCGTLSARANATDRYE
jgi:hypothetical protein